MKPLKTLLPALALLLLAGCERDMDPVEFNDALEGYNRRLAAAALEFKSKVIPVAEGNAPDVAAIEAIYRKLVETVDDVRKRFGQLNVPKDSKPMQDFRDAYDRFLTVQESLVKVNFQAIATIAASPQVAPDVKKVQILGNFAAIKAAEDRERKTLQAAQDQFAKDVGIRLIDDRKDPNAFK